jgi:hypothetical protein
MRAGKGLLISTYAQDQAVADHLAASEAQSILQQGHDSMHMLSTLAVKQQTDALNVINRLPKLIQSVELKGPIKHSKQPLVYLKLQLVRIRFRH